MTLYGFYWTDCIHESGLMLQSLHASKAGAYRAMTEAQFARWVACRSGTDSRLHLGLPKYDPDYRRFRAYENYTVQPVKVQP